MLKKLIIGAAIATALTSPALAQSYTAGNGTGNPLDVPLAEKTNGAYGFGGTVAPTQGDTGQSILHGNTASAGARGAFAFAPTEGAAAPMHKQRSRTH